MNTKKSFWKSKTIWINGLLLIGGVFTALAHDMAQGGALSIIGIINLVLRVITTTELK